MATFDDIDSLMTNASNSVLALDYTQAIRYALAAQALFASLPTEQEKSGYAGSRAKWTPETINDFIANARKAMANDPAAVKTTSGFIKQCRYQLSDQRGRT